ncbi:MAG: energy-coupling factor ABC transporter ATP-binding protein [Thermodesulfobacteriota bacterium]
MSHQRQPVIELSGIEFSYPGADPVFRGLDFSFFSGDRVGLLAPNGSGKTTFFLMIMGLIRPDKGEVKIFGQPARREKDFVRIRQRIGLLFQDADDQLFCPTVLEDVAFGPMNMGKPKSEAMEIARKTLAFLGLTGYEDKITFQLSGGEKRLVSLAAVLAMKPEVLLLDEPLTGLDIRTRKIIPDILRQIDLSYIIISHNIDFLLSTTRAIYTLDQGKIILDPHVHHHQHEHAHLFGDRPHQH